ncbi:MAG TPA: hypothetical protein VK430_09960 [Xanthobacteraceae bacterium]|nr:hypothetical protein [Xanthobacteraceae bacterium]
MVVKAADAAISAIAVHLAWLRKQIINVASEFSRESNPLALATRHEALPSSPVGRIAIREKFKWS